MQDSWRITINDIDRSKVAAPVSREVGAMVVKASRGPNLPMFFDRGASTDILDAFGPITYGDEQYHELLEALEFNSYSPIYLSSFYTAGEVSPDVLGGVVINPLGVTALTSGTSLTPAEMAAKTYDQFKVQTPAVGNVLYPNGLLDTECVTYAAYTEGIDAADYALFPEETYPDGIPAYDAGPPEVGLSKYPDGITRAQMEKFPNGILFADIDAGVTIPAYVPAIKADYFLLTTKSPHKDGGAGFGVSVQMDNTVEGTLANPVFTINVYKKLSDDSWKLVETYANCSLQSTSLDKYKNTNYILAKLVNSKYVDVLVNPDLTMEALAADRWPTAYAAPTVALGGSTRADIEDTEAAREACWDVFQQKTRYPVDIFMDASGLSAIAAKFKELGTTYQKYAMYLIALPIDMTAGDLATAYESYSGLNFRNGVAYWNSGYVTTSYYGGTLPMLTSLIGRVGIKYAQMQNIYDAMPPCMFDENGYGGQLDAVGNCGKVRSMYNDPSDELQKIMNNEYCINPIIWDPTDGTMIGGQKTLQDPSYVSDTSYVCHVRVFNYIKRNALSKVFTRQATKYNDDTHRFMVKSGLEAIIAPLLSNKFLAQAKVVCGSSNNTPDVLAQRQFVASMAVRVTPTSEAIIFNFVNVDQNTDVNEVI